ncbi:hypothetical protein G7Y79_00008g025230 [Physcia stellaris]|nr:hypothetical protein G7Y79_00008g025230 [Physcia stellaris]
MHSTTLSLTALLGIMSSFQGIVALPASSASSSSPESTTILGTPLSFDPDSTTTLGEPVQATPTATLPLPTTMNPTSTPGSESNDSVTQIYSRDITKDAWVEIHDNSGCGGKPIVKRINLGGKYISDFIFLHLRLCTLCHNHISWLPGSGD